METAVQENTWTPPPSKRLKYIYITTQASKQGEAAVTYDWSNKFRTIIVVYYRKKQHQAVHFLTLCCNVTEVFPTAFSDLQGREKAAF